MQIDANHSDASRKTAPARVDPIAVAFREVRHFRPDDCLHVESIGVRGQLEGWHNGWTIPAHRHEGLHQFQWLAEGSAQVAIDGKEWQVQAPAALMLTPGCVHSFRYAPQSLGHQVTVPSGVLTQGFGGAPTLAARLDSSPLIATGLASQDVQALATLFGQIVAEFELDSPGRVEALQSQAMLLALWYLRHAEGARTDERPQALRDTLTRRFRALVAQHYREQKPLAFYADALKVTPDHLSRACRAVAGMSALDIVHERVVLEARRMLAYTEMPVGEIAQSLGFDDSQYFSRFFAKRSGAAPTVYRLRVAEGRSEAPSREG